MNWIAFEVLAFLTTVTATQRSARFLFSNITVVNIAAIMGEEQMELVDSLDRAKYFTVQRQDFLYIESN